MTARRCTALLVRAPRFAWGGAYRTLQYKPGSSKPHSACVREAIRKIDADFNRSADTHLIPLDLPGYADVRFYLKDESSHPTGSLKQRLARSLFLYALCNGWFNERSTVVEAPSGGTGETLGRYVACRRHTTRVMCADPESSVFFDSRLFGLP